MTKEQIESGIEEMDEYIPVSKIEEKLGMPPTTLQKVLSGKRTLPKKWHRILGAYFGIRAKKTAKSNDSVDISNHSSKTPKENNELIAQYEKEITTLGNSALANRMRKHLENKIRELKLQTL